jgi:hypothetical protein
MICELHFIVIVSQMYNLLEPQMEDVNSSWQFGEPHRSGA